MDTNDTDVIRVSKPEKRTLLAKYGIPVEHLSYEYISECRDGQKLERMVTILRSGEEGFYPDLVKHAEKCLAAIKPTSVVLRKSEPILKRNMLGPSECKELDDDIDKWTSEMQCRERDIEEGKNSLIAEPLPQPKIRQFKEETAKKQTVTNAKNTGKTKRISSCDYTAWDKYDVDTELSKIDIRDEQKRVEDKRFQQKQKEVKHNVVDRTFNKSSLTGTELDFLAGQEREKGNEAFRAGEYQEALRHYNASIQMNSNILSYNNRAMTFIKLRRYEDALNDCNFVLSVEYTNIKALLRRAVSLEHLDKSPQALMDYETILKLEPTNSTAIAAVRKLRKPCDCRKIRMKIEEKGEEEYEEPKFDKVEKNINYCTNSELRFNTGNSICYCDRAPGPSQNLRPRPHFKAEYCLDNENKQKVTIKSDTTKKRDIDRHKNIMELPKNSNTKLKSIFSCTVPDNRGSSVIIEELPNEPCDNKTNIKNKPNGTLASNNIPKSDSANKNKIHENKIAHAANIQNHGKIHENNNSCENNNMIFPRNVNVADKCETNSTKSEKCTAQNFDNIGNPYEFVRMWQSLKNDNDLEMHAKLLRSVKAEKLSTVLGSELDGKMFSTILRCLNRHFCTPDDTDLLNNFLTSISQVKRFSIVNMFMNAEDKQAVNNILNFLEERKTSGVSSLRQIYCI